MENIHPDGIRSIFKFRTRMAPFGENFRGGKESAICPLCDNHIDSQSMSFSCPVLRSKIDIKCEMEEVYSDEISLETAETLRNIINVREQLEKLKKETEK